MNYSITQQTGALAEHDVERLFLTWRWTVGKDLIDVGYDLNVEPDQSRFKGHRFLVQVKGTASRKSGKVVAPVSKKRLRQYAINPLPVFLIRRTADGVLYWIHVQAWARTNERRLDGDGTSGVVIPSGQVLEDCETFSTYLSSIFLPLPETQGAIAALAEDRTRYLSALDPRFDIQIEYVDGVESYKIFAREPGAAVEVQIQPSAGDDGVESMENTIKYGLPSTIAVDSVNFQGSQLFDAIGANTAISHTLSLESTSAVNGVVTLMAGAAYSILACQLDIDARLFRGRSGFSISNEGFDGLVQFKLLADVRENQGTRLQFTIGVREEFASSEPIRSRVALKAFGDWSRDTLLKNSLSFHFDFDGKRVPIKVGDTELRQLRELLVLGGFVGHLHEVARALNSDFVLYPTLAISAKDMSDVELLYRLLRGQREPIRLGPMEFEALHLPDITPGSLIMIRTRMGFSVGRQILGEIPVAIDLSEFAVEAGGEQNKFRIIPAQEGAAHIYYSEGSELDEGIQDSSHKLFRKA